MMKLTIKTDVFKEMVSRAIKGASQNKLIPLTGLMAIQLQDNEVTLITTDASNYLYIKQDNIVGDEFDAVVQVDQFSKLIGKMTCENIILEVDNGILNVKGNGNYRIELPLDEEGNTIKFPDPASDVDTTEGTEVTLMAVKTILNTIKPALAVTMEVPVYTRYYMGEKVIATDTYKIASLDADVLHTEPLLMSVETMNLLDVMTCETIDLYRNDDVLLFDTPDCVVYGHAMEGVDEYNVDGIGAVLDEQFNSKCTLDRSALLSVLDRIGLFVGQYDNRAIILTFSTDGVDVSSKASTGVETIEYINSESPVSYTCTIDIDMLATQIKANTADSIELQYGNDSSIKIVDGDITQIIALLGEE